MVLDPCSVIDVERENGFSFLDPGIAFSLNVVISLWVLILVELGRQYDRLIPLT